MKALMLAVLAVSLSVPAWAERDGLKGRLGVGLSRGGATPVEGRELEGGAGASLHALYGLSRNLALDLSLGADWYDTKNKFFRGGAVRVGAYTLGARYAWRVDKRFLPYVKAGAGLYASSYTENDGSRVYDDVAGLSYSYDIDNAFGVYGGAGFTWFMTENRNWSFGMDVQAASARAGATRSLTSLGSGATVETTKKFNFGGTVVSALDFSYYF